MASKSLTFDIFGRDRTASKAIRGVGKSAGILTKQFQAVGSAIAAAFAVRSIVRFASATVQEFAQAEASQQKLSYAFEQFPALVGANKNALVSLNTELQKKTRFDDDALAAGQAQLAQYGLTAAQLEKITPLLADYAARTGKDVTSAAEDLGKAFLGSGRALKLIGVDFVDTGTVAGNFEEVVAALSDKVGGFAEKDAQTLTGQLEVLKNAFGEVKEAAGSVFAPAIGLLAQTINDKLLPVMATLVDKYGPQIEDFFTSAAGAAGNLFDDINAALSDGTITDNLPVIVTSFAALGSVLMEEGVIDALKTLATSVLPPLVDLLVALAPAIPPLATVLSTILVPALQITSALITGITAAFSDNKVEQDNWVASIVGIPGIVGDAFRNLAGNLIGVANGVIDVFNGLSEGWERLAATFGVTLNLPRLSHGSLAALAAPSGFSASGASGLKLVSGGGRYAEGGYFQARPGGYLGVIGEGASDEIALPLTPDKLRQVGAGIAEAGGVGAGQSATTHKTLNVNVYGVDGPTAVSMLTQKLRSGLVTI